MIPFQKPGESIFYIKRNKTRLWKSVILQVTPSTINSAKFFNHSSGSERYGLSTVKVRFQISKESYKYRHIKQNIENCL